jgi:hypothetical protein
MLGTLPLDLRTLRFFWSLARRDIHAGLFLYRNSQIKTSPPPFIFTGTIVARKAPRQRTHRFAASGLDPLRHPGVLAAMSSTPQPAARIPLPPSHP